MTDEGILITPSAIDKGRLKGRQICRLCDEESLMMPGLKLSIESGMHLAIYKTRSDVKAVVHAHPPTATAFTAMNKEINCTLIAEARAILGTPIMAPYALMGTDDLASVTASVAAGKMNPGGPLPNVILLQNHGIVCLGKDLLTAFDRLEVMEAAAKMTVITTIMGSANQLTHEQLVAIDTMMNVNN
jgi:L-fuculose-phosphate aldolase